MTSWHRRVRSSCGRFHAVAQTMGRKLNWNSRISRMAKSKLFWLDSSGERRSYGKLESGKKKSQHTYSGHVWIAVDDRGATIAAFQAVEAHRAAVITGNDIPRPPRRRGRSRRAASPSRESPDGKWQAVLRDNNLFLRFADGGDELQLTKDGTADRSYRRVQWSPDSRTLAAFRVREGDSKGSVSHRNFAIRRRSSRAALATLPTSGRRICIA